MDRSGGCGKRNKEKREEGSKQREREKRGKVTTRERGKNDEWRKNDNETNSFGAE